MKAPLQRDHLTEPAVVRWMVTAVALAFVGLFLIVPLAAVFIEAFSNGIEAYGAAIVEPDALAALRLTLLSAAIAVPNTNMAASVVIIFMLIPLRQAHEGRQAPRATAGTKRSSPGGGNASVLPSSALW